MAQALCSLLPVLTVISHLVPSVAAAANTKNVVAAPRPADCRDKCGEVDIPYPYGIGKRCSWQGNNFVTCNHSFTPPRPYLSNGNLEVISISVLSGETRVLVPVSTLCYNSTMNFTYTNQRLHLTNLFISATRNEFTAIGCNTLAQMKGPSYYSGCITSCVSLAAAARDGENCTGLGCCQTSLPQNLTYLGVGWGNTSNGNPVWGFSPCSYAFIAEKGWYVTYYSGAAIKFHGNLHAVQCMTSV